MGDYEVCMLASFPLLYSVANYAASGLEETSFEEKKSAISTRMRGLQKIDWSPANREWREFKGSERGNSRGRFYFINSDKANMLAILSWLQLQGGE